MRKRSAYRQKWAKVNTLELVQERIRPVEKQGDWVLDRKLKQANALAALMRGDATRDHVADLMATHNMTYALQRYSKGEEYQEITDRSREAMVALTNRYAKTGKFLLTGTEIQAIRDLIELHDAQLEICTVGDVDEAYRYATRVRDTGCQNTRLNSKFAGDYK